MPAGAEVVDRVIAAVLLIDPAGMCQITDLPGNLIKAGSFVSQRMTVRDQSCEHGHWDGFCFFVTVSLSI